MRNGDGLGVLIGLFVVIVFGLVIFGFFHQLADCNAIGGVLVKGGFGYVCVVAGAH